MAGARGWRCWGLKVVPVQAAAGLLLFWGGEQMCSRHRCVLQPVRDAAAVAWTALLPHDLGCAGGAGWTHEWPSLTGGFCKDPRGTCRMLQPPRQQLLDPSFGELTPSSALFPRQKGLVHLQAALQRVSGGVCCCLRGLCMGSGCCLLSTQALNALKIPQIPMFPATFTHAQPENSNLSFYFWERPPDRTLPYAPQAFPTPLCFTSRCWKLLSARPESRRGMKRWRVRR